MTREKTATIVSIVSIAKKRTTATVKTVVNIGTTAVIETTTIVARAYKIFKKRAIIVKREEIAIIIARISRKDNVASFKRKEK